MKKSEMVKSLLQKLHKARWELGFFYAIDNQKWSAEQQATIHHNMLMVQAQESILSDLANDYECFPVGAEWYKLAFDEGMKAESLEEYQLPIELM